jgi:alpha-beta hydrolase superfamily lysophospholipase
MDLSKKALIQSVLAFFIGVIVCALFAGSFLQKPTKQSSIETDKVTIITKTQTVEGTQQTTAPKNPDGTKVHSNKSTEVIAEKTTPAATTAIPIGPVEKPPAAFQGSIKRVDYDVPSRFSSWSASGAPVKGVIICAHGFGLYSEAFAALAKRVCPKGYPTYSIDARGFGRNMKSDDTMDFDGTVEDIGQLIKLMRSTYPNKPIVLLGESMGGAMVIKAGALHENEIAGIVASAPGDSRYKQTKMDLKVGPKLLLAPKKEREWGDELMEMATSNPMLIEKWRVDPLVRQKMAAADLLKFQSFMGKTNDSAKKIHSIPILFIHGGHDKLMKVKGTVELFNDVPSTKKDLFILGQRDHVMLEEGQFDDKTIRLLETWLANVPMTHR